MAIDFPPNPQVNDVYTFGSKSWTWNGYSWVLSSTISSATSTPLATNSLTGVASFNGAYFTVGTTGAVSLAPGYQVTGDTVVAGTNITINRVGNAVTVNSTASGGGSVSLATDSITGVASFTANDFSVSPVGMVSLTGGLVRSFNGLTGNVIYSPVIATTSVTGVASFNSTHFSVAGNGAVSLAAAYQVTGDTVVAGTNVNISRSGNSVTVNSTQPLATSSVTGVASFGNEFVVSSLGAISLTGNYVRSFNGLTGTVVYAPPLATTSVTGVASFNTNDFTVSTGAVSLSNVARTNAANTFTSLQTFNAGITTQSLFVSQGATFASRTAFNAGFTAANAFISAGATLNSSLYVGGNSTLGGSTANTIMLPSSQVIKTYTAQTSSTSTYTLFTESMFFYSGADILIQAEKWGDGSVSSGLYTGTLGVHNTRISVVANPDGFGVNHVQYGSVFTGSTAASYDVDSDGAGGWRLRVTPNSTYVTTLRVKAILSPNNGGSGA